jgi:hypothetical protein
MLSFHMFASPQFRQSFLGFPGSFPASPDRVENLVEVTKSFHFKLFHTLLRFFARSQNSTVLFSGTSTLLGKNTGGMGVLAPLAHSASLRMGEGRIPYFSPSSLQQPLLRPIAAQPSWCHNCHRRNISSPSGETTPLPSVSKDSERTSGTGRRRSPLQVVPGSIVLSKRVF